MNQEEKTEAAKRMEQIDSHMYYDEKDHVDPNEAPEQLQYAPVRNVRRETKETESKEKKNPKPRHLTVKPYESPPDQKKKSSTLSRSRSSAQKTLQSTAAQSEHDALHDKYGIHMENLTPFTKQGDFHITNTWTLGPLSEMSYEEKTILKMATKRQIKKLHEQADQRFDDSKNKSLMISDDDHQIRNEAMRRIAI